MSYPENIYDAILQLEQEMTTLYPQELSENDDLDALGVGVYIIPTEAVCATLLHKPLTSNPTGLVIVRAGGGDGQLIMHFIACSKNYPAYRQRAYYGGSWGEWSDAVPYDCGYKSLTLASGVIAHNANDFPCRYRRIGKVVYVEGCVKGFAETDKVVATLPEGYRPNKSFYSIQATSGGNTDTFNVRTNGEIRRVGGSLSSISATDYHFIHFEFLVD